MFLFSSAGKIDFKLIFLFFRIEASENSIPGTYFSPTEGSEDRGESTISGAGSATSSETVRQVLPAPVNWSCLERAFAEASVDHPKPSNPTSNPIYQGLYGRQPEPRFRAERGILWSGPLPSSHFEGYRSSLAGCIWTIWDGIYPILPR